MSNSTIHFRTSPPLSDQLSQRAYRWNVSRHETARRLMVLADSQLTTNDHDRVEQFASDHGVGFAAAATMIVATKE